MTDEKNEIPDSVLLERYAQGDPEAFEIFFIRHRGRVYQYVLRKMEQPETALELTQDVFVKLHAKVHLYQSGSPALNWFFTLVHNTCVDALRKSSRERSVVLNSEFDSNGRTDESISLESSNASPDTHTDRVIGLLGSLPSEQRRIVESRVFEERSFASLSQETGKSELALRKIYSRAVQKIKSLLNATDNTGEEK